MGCRDAGVKGNIVELHCEEIAVHDTILIAADIMGFEASAWNVAFKVVIFVEKF